MVSSDELPKIYDFAEVEERWRKSWRDEDHYFDHNSKKPQFVIDTPPPYPTGNFHIGNALNWCYIDFFARYKRMKGYNVMFPQGLGLSRSSHRGKSRRTQPYHQKRCVA